MKDNNEEFSLQLTQTSDEFLDGNGLFGPITVQTPGSFGPGERGTGGGGGIFSKCLSIVHVKPSYLEHSYLSTLTFTIASVQFDDGKYHLGATGMYLPMSYIFSLSLLRS